MLCIPLGLGAAGCFAIVLNAMRYISATKVTVIIQANPILAMFLAAIILKENVSNYDKVAVVVMIVGIATITYHNTNSSVDLPNPLLGYTFAVIACVALANIMIGIRKSSQVVHFLVYPFHLTSGMLIIAAGAYFLSEDGVNPSKYHTKDFLASWMSALGSLGGQVFTSVAYKYGEASAMAPFWGCQNVFIFFFEFYVLDYDFSITDALGKYKSL